MSSLPGASVCICMYTTLKSRVHNVLCESASHMQLSNNLHNIFGLFYITNEIKKKKINCKHRKENWPAVEPALADDDRWWWWRWCVACMQFAAASAVHTRFSSASAVSPPRKKHTKNKTKKYNSLMRIAIDDGTYHTTNHSFIYSCITCAEYMVSSPKTKTIKFH